MDQSSYPAAVLEAGARALAERAGVFGDYDDLDMSYQLDLQRDAAAVLDTCFSMHMANIITDELDRRIALRQELNLYPEGERRAAAVRNGLNVDRDAS